MKEDKDNFIAAVEEAKQRLAAGEKPEDIFDNYDDFDEEFARVVIDGKYNYINSDRKLLSDTWFDWCGYFGKRFAIVKLNKKWNYIDRNGYILSTTWFDDCRCFRDGFATVELNEKWNFIDHNGNILSDKWFNYCGNFSEEFGRVKLNGKDYYVRKDGVLCDYDTKEPIESANIDYKKKYEEALERAKDIYNDDPNSGTARAVCEQIFPEVNESEDKKIRKFISHELACLRANDEKGSDRYEELTNAITWLEKKSEIINEYEDKLDRCACESFDKGYKAALEKQCEQKVDKCKDCNNVKGCIICTDGDQYAHITEQKPTDWSEEDEEEFKWICVKLQEHHMSIEYTERVRKAMSWLESIKKLLKGE